MDIHEATETVMSRIHSLDPENATKIMGFILLQEEGEKEMIRLAFSPESYLVSYINRAKAFLKHSLSSPSSNSNPSTPLSTVIRPNNPPFLQIPSRILGPSSGLHLKYHPSSPVAGFSNSPRNISNSTNFGDSNGGLGLSRSSLSSSFYGGDDDRGVEMIMGPTGRRDSLFFPDGENGSNIASPHSHPFHRRSYSVNDASLLDSVEDENGGWKPCLFYSKGFCKNGSNCKFLHSGANEMGSPSNIDLGFHEYLKLKAIQEQKLALMASRGHNPFAYNRGVDFLDENQRSAVAALTMGEEFNRLGRSLSDRINYRAMGSIESANSSSRQIYLTFPADSNFKEEDVSNYFSMYGPVQDVRIPYQQQRMFGFVTFAHPETVKLILEKGNPHFICNCRVLVKPYKEKGKLMDRKHHLEREEYMACSSPPPRLASREDFDVPLASKFFYNAQEMLQRRKLEEREAELQHILEQEGRWLMNLQLMDSKNQLYNHQMMSSLSATLPASYVQSQLRKINSVVLPSDGINQEMLEINRKQEKVASDEKLPTKSTENGNKEISSTEVSNLQDSLEHALLDKSISQSNSSEEAITRTISTTTPNNIPKTYQQLGHEHGF